MIRAGCLAALVVAVAGARAAEAPPTDLVKAGATAIHVNGDWLAAGAGGVWLSGELELIRLDGATGRVAKRIPVLQGPCEASDVGFGAVWTATCGKPGLARIDPARNRLRHVPLPVPRSLDGEGSIGVGSGAVWLVLDGPSCAACRLARVDPSSLRVVARIPVAAGSSSVRVGYGAVWVVNPPRGLVQKVDPRRNRLVGTTKVGPRPRFFAVGEGGVWTLNQGDGSVTRLEPATMRVRATIAAATAAT